MTQTVPYPITKRSQLSTFFLSLRPKTLILTAMPVAVGTLLMELPLSKINWWIAFFALFSAMSIQIACNLINDAFDVQKGVDDENRLGPLRGAQLGVFSTQQVYFAGLLFLGLGLLFGIPLMIHQGFFMGGFLFLSACLSYLYTGGPYPLSYLGMGDFLAFGFYGILNTSICYYLQAGAINAKVLLASMQMGCFPTAIIAINNFRDMQSDAKAGRKTLAVRFGERFSRVEIGCMLLLPFVLNLVWAFITGHFLAPLFSATTCFFAVYILKKIRQHPPGRIYNRFLSETAILHLLFGILFLIGYRLDLT